MLHATAAGGAKTRRAAPVVGEERRPPAATSKLGGARDAAGAEDATSVVDPNLGADDRDAAATPRPGQGGGHLPRLALAMAGGPPAREREWEAQRGETGRGLQDGKERPRGRKF